MQYYRLIDDVEIPNRWHLDQPAEHIDGAPNLISGVAVENASTFPLEMTRKGRALEFCLTGLAVPVMSRNLAGAMAALACPDVQLVSATIEGAFGYKALNVARTIDCLDEKTSRFMKWKISDGRPDKVGQYRMVTELRLDLARIAADAKVFRSSGWIVAMIVSGAIKQEMEHQGCFGAKFIPVT